MKLISLAETKTLLPQTGTAYDALITLIIEGNSALVEKHLNRYLKKQARTERYSGGSRYYWLPAFPVDPSAELVVVEDGVELVEEQDYAVNKTTGQIEFLVATTKRVPMPISITWTGGFDETTVGVSPNQETVLVVPDAIRLATYLQTNYVYRRKDKLGLETVELGNMGSVALQGVMSLIPEVKKLLESERRLPQSV